MKTYHEHTAIIWARGQKPYNYGQTVDVGEMNFYPFKGSRPFASVRAHWSRIWRQIPQAWLFNTMDGYRNGTELNQPHKL